MANYYAVTYSSSLSHHGILGQKWGKRNGPPYPIDPSDHSAREKKAGWRKSLKKGPHWENDTPSFKIVKKPTQRRQMTDEEKAKLKKVLVTTGVIAVGALALYGAHRMAGQYYCRSLMEDNPELFDRIRKDVVKKPNDLYDSNLWNDLPENEIKAIKGYTDNDYIHLNSVLRKGKLDVTDSETQEKISAITSAIDKSPLKEELVTFRGVNMNTANNFMFPNVDLRDGKNAREQLLGATFQEDGFFSSSPRYQSQFAGGNGVKLTTICPPGTKALYIGKESNYPYEKELLLQRGTQFEIKDVVVDNLGYVTEIIMEAVNAE